jgi:hypothetical protein
MMTILTIRSIFSTEMWHAARRVWWVILSLLLCLTISGCNTYNQNSCTWAGAQAGLGQSFNTPACHNPNLIFDQPSPPKPSQRYAGVPSDQFYRSDWPLADVPSGYADQGEQVVYREYRYDNQYISPDNCPRQFFSRQIQGYRVGSMSR